MVRVDLTKVVKKIIKFETDSQISIQNMTLILHAAFFFLNTVLQLRSGSNEKCLNHILV